MISLEGGFVAYRLSAFIATVDYNKALFGVGKSLNGSKNALTFIGSVTGIYINVKRAKAEWTVISRGVAKRLNLSAAILTNKARIVLFKSLVFHNAYLPLISSL